MPIPKVICLFNLRCWFIASPADGEIFCCRVDSTKYNMMYKTPAATRCDNPSLTCQKADFEHAATNLLCFLSIHPPSAMVHWRRCPMAHIYRTLDCPAQSNFILHFILHFSATDYINPHRA